MPVVDGEEPRAVVSVVLQEVVAREVASAEEADAVLGAGVGVGVELEVEEEEDGEDATAKVPAETRTSR